MWISTPTSSSWTAFGPRTKNCELKLSKYSSKNVKSKQNWLFRDSATEACKRCKWEFSYRDCLWAWAITKR
jgi:hypothetical protein